MKPHNTEPRDFMESITDFDPRNAAEKFIKKIYEYMIDNKDKLGNARPYFVVSNDLVTKYAGFMQLCLDYKCHPNANFINEITALLIQSYEPGETTKGLWHSKPKTFVEPLVDVWLSVSS